MTLHFKHPMIFLLLCLLLLCPMLGLGEAEGGEGEIIFYEAEEIPSDLLSSETAPFAPENVDRVILGRDDRVTVSNPREYPYSAIANILGTYKCGCTMQGTGFMVGKDTLMTAAHCLVCQKHNEWAKTLDFYFGFKNRSNYLYSYNGRWTGYVNTTFPNGYHSDNDWGYIRFEKNVGDSTGWFGMKFLTDREIERGWYYVAGYKDNLLKYDIATMTALSSNQVNLDADVLPGNSGSPIFDKEYYVVALWTSFTDTENFAHRMTTEIYNKLHSEGVY